MCLIVFDWQPHATPSLKLAANRDEYHARPTLPLHRWGDGSISGGRDGEQGGTWLAAAPGGRFAALTNVRESAGMAPPSPPSRGKLVRTALETDDLDAWLKTLANGGANAYAGFNLISLREDRLWHLHHGRDGTTLARVTPGWHVLSNATLDTPWPKVRRVRTAARRATREGWKASVRTALRDTRVAPDASLPATGVDAATERLLSAPFILGEHYGTRALTLATVDIGGRARLEEERFGPGAKRRGDVSR